MEIFYIEADRWMTGGATRGQSGEIITKIEREVNDRREKGKGITTLRWIDWQWPTERERGRTERCRRREEQVMSNRGTN